MNEQVKGFSLDISKIKNTKMKTPYWGIISLNQTMIHSL